MWKTWQGAGALLRLETDPSPSTVTPPAIKGVLEIPSQVLSVTRPGSRAKGIKAPYLIVSPRVESPGSVTCLGVSGREKLPEKELPARVASGPH